ncbi:DUF6461 domain-containing protein [Yinghuangia sp. YIM S10712]|uniref:DUF6461 domain-containing protein n=1 Tax=Yinghuangia sp. YIM S10712 TaxID=3436930 RepID=UPI003F5314D6
MSTPTALDYLWFDEHYPDLAEAYCVLLVRGTTPEALMDQLGVEERCLVSGAGGLDAHGLAAWDRHHGDRLFAAVTSVGDWTLMIEPNGYLGSLEAIIQPLSLGTTVVSHFRNVNAVDRFNWFEDGELRLHFEPLFPYQREGRDADTVVDEMLAVGFDLAEDGDTDLTSEAAFALTERITGVRLTHELFEAAEFQGGTAPLPPK